MRVNLKYSVVLLILCVNSCTSMNMSAYPIRYNTVYNRKYVLLKDVARFYGMKIIQSKKGCQLYSKYSKIRFTYNRREGSLNGVKVHYHFAPFVYKNEPVISEKDFLLIIDPVLRYNALKKHKIYTIMIDPGHGKQDNGAEGRLFKEKNLVLKLAKKVKEKLSKYGYKVILTRSDDTFLTLQKRCDLCNKNKIDLFISIHCNSAGLHSAQGIETFALTPSNVPSTSDAQPQKQNNVGNKNDKNNFRLAYEVQKQLLNMTNGVDRGVKHARFYVLKRVNCPAILVEVGFLSNKAEERKLGFAAYQERICQAIVKGIYKYHRELIKIKK